VGECKVLKQRGNLQTAQQGGSTTSIIDLTSGLPDVSHTSPKIKGFKMLASKKQRVSKNISLDIEVADTPTSTQRALSMYEVTDGSLSDNGDTDMLPVSLQQPCP
jgi:hypothetical protein